MLQLFSMGVKRKFDEFDSFVNEEGNIGVQRQSILDISMCKLRTNTGKRVEPPLLRSVLILNTLKCIETDLINEGCKKNPVPDTSSLRLSEVEPRDSVLDVLPCHTSVGNMEVDNSSSVQQTGPLPSIDTFMGNRSQTADPAKNVKQDLCHSEKSLPGGIPDSSPSSFLPPLKTDEMLADLDFSLCDYDIFSSIANGMKLTPLSAEEVLHSVPSHSGNFNDSYAMLLPPPVTPFCKGEVALEDLDNIMQILVGS